MKESWLLNIVVIALVGLVFWAIKKMLDKVDSRVEKVEGTVEQQALEIDRQWKEHDATRDGLLETLMKESDHKLICRATQAELKLHISETVEDSRNIMIKAIKENKQVMMNALKDLKKELKQEIKKNGGNGAI